MQKKQKYYEAYDLRYRQVHNEKLQWSSRLPTPIVSEVIDQFRIPDDGRLLEIGCGEGRDAASLLDRGYDLLATDVSREAIEYCRRMSPEYAGHYRVLDCLKDQLEDRYDYIFAVAVIHMLVPDADRDGFCRFIRNHLKDSGIGLICSMGDGTMERSSDITEAYKSAARVHAESGRMLYLAGTSCRMVSFDTFLKELERNGLSVIRHGLTSCEPDFSVMMYAVVKRKS